MIEEELNLLPKKNFQSFSRYFTINQLVYFDHMLIFGQVTIFDQSFRLILLSDHQPANSQSLPKLFPFPLLLFLMVNKKLMLLQQSFGIMLSPKRLVFSRLMTSSLRYFNTRFRTEFHITYQNESVGDVLWRRSITNGNLNVEQKSE